MKVLLLKSYCNDNDCHDYLPCEKCLKLCRVVTIADNTVKRGDYPYGYLRQVYNLREKSKVSVGGNQIKLW